MLYYLWRKLGRVSVLRRVLGFAFAAVVTVGPPPAAHAAVALPACVGDCNSDGSVTVDELVTGVNIALGTAGLDRCPAFDSSQDDDVTVDELVAGVKAALSGCPGPTGSPPCANGAAPGQPCGDGNRVDGDGCSSQCVVEGCASGNRGGLKDYRTYPHVAACGTLTDYLTAVAQAASTCQAGWHMCTLYSSDLDSIAASPKPAEPFTAWLQYDDVDCTFHEVFDAPACAGTVVMGARYAHQFPHGCTGLGYCGEGYAPALYQSTWQYSAHRQGNAACTEHIVNLCGYTGGSVSVVPSYTACCRD